MATKKKMLQAAAGNATGGAGLDITEVFSTYLYEGNSGTLSVNNGIDFSGEGGLVWIKNREAAFNHLLIDTARGGNKYLYADNAAAQGSLSSAEQFTLSSTGFSSTAADFNWNNSNYDYASWTFRKAPKFFDVVTWTGDGVAGREIAHNLGTTVGSIFVKRTDATRNWAVYHRSLGATKYLALNETNAENTATSRWNDTEPTSTVFTVGSAIDTNVSGGTYVAYLFAHNDGDGEFGPDGDQDIIKCGSFSVNGSYEADVDIGFEPQWVLIKPAQDSGSWLLFDTMRGAAVNGDAAWLAPDLSQQEVNTANRFWPTATGFHIGNYGIPAGNDIIYMAIRRGPLAQPESATDVFDTVTGSGVQSTGFPVDFLIGLNNRTNTESYDPFVKTRLLGGASYLTTSSTAAEASGSDVGFDTMDGLTYSWPNSNAVAWNWKRAPGFFDVVAYTGTGGTTSQKPHNLGVVPEMIWIKTRSLTGREWVVWVNGFGTGQTNGTGTKEWLYLNGTNALQSSTSASNVPWGGPHTATTFSTGSWSRVNDTGETYIAYLFASLDGISKVGSYTGDGTTGQTIDCGFASGARFILIKRTDTSSNWFVWDTERGIVSGNDPYLRLNRDLAEETTQDDVDPQSSGFIVNQGENNLNQSGGSYIFYAIA